MSTTPRPSKADRRDEARQAALRVKEQQEREAKRQRTILLSIIGVALVALGGVIWFIFSQADSTESSRIAPVDFSEVEQPLDEVTRPAGGTDDGGILVGQDGVIADGQVPEGATVISVYQDFMCPHCASFEGINAPALDELLADGDTVVKLHPIAIMDGSSTSQFSTRAAAAVAAVADGAPEAVMAFNRLVFANQPAAGTAGPSDADLAELARQAGAGDDVVATIADGSYVRGSGGFREWVGAATEQAARDLPRVATPTIFIDEAELSQLGVDWRVPGALTSAVEAARG